MSKERDAIGPLLIAFLPTMRRFAISLTRSPDVADDLVQQACERALINAASFTPGTRFDAWMFRIIRNLWIDRIRKSKTEAAVPEEEGDTVVGADGVQVTDARLALSDTARAMQELPDEQREVIMLVCVEELSYAEAAAVIGSPIGTIMSRLARGRERLAGLLAERGIKVASPRSPGKGDQL